LKIAGIRDFGWIIVSHHPDDLLGLVDWLWILESRHLVYNGPMADVPLEVVNNNFPSKWCSLFTFLKSIEKDGVSLPKNIFSCTDKKIIVEELQKKIL
jgi:hypothetical protein